MHVFVCDYITCVFIKMLLKSNLIASCPSKCEFVIISLGDIFAKRTAEMPIFDFRISEFFPFPFMQIRRMIGHFHRVRTRS